MKKVWVRVDSLGRKYGAQEQKNDQSITEFEIQKLASKNKSEIRPLVPGRTTGTQKNEKSF